MIKFIRIIWRYKIYSIKIMFIVTIIIFITIIINITVLKITVLIIYSNKIYIQSIKKLTQSPSKKPWTTKLLKYGHLIKALN